MLTTKTPITFLFSQYWWLYVCFTATIAILLIIINLFFTGNKKFFTTKQAIFHSAFWFILAIIFNIFFYFFAKQYVGLQQAKVFSLEFLTGYLLEKALAIDNIFVFVVIFKFFKIPRQYQYKVLFLGLIGAIIFRGLFIFAGSFLIQYKWLLIIFGIFLILTGIKLLISNTNTNISNDNYLIRFFLKLKFVSLEDYNITNGKFFYRKDGKIFITRLLIALCIIEISDIIFALDSIPAIFSITQETLIVFTTNILAILGLRALYFLIYDLIEKLSYLKYGLAVILIFVGIKMSWLNQIYNEKSLIIFSLVFILSTLILCIFGSLYKNSHMR